MTALASGGDMPAGQRESRYTMIKLADTPGAVVMTVLTYLASLAFVFVVLFVATQTLQWRFAVALQILVASCALDFRLGMGVAQNKTRLLMFKATRRSFPVGFAVAIRTFFA